MCSLRLRTCLMIACAIPLLAHTAVMKHNTGPKDDRECRNAYDKVTASVAKKHGLELIIHGCGPIVDDERVVWCVGLISRRPSKIDEARAIITDLATQLSTLVTRDPVFLRYVNNRLSERRKPTVDTVPLEKVGAKITFWDANTDRYQRPYVAQVKLAGDTITYYYADPNTQALVDPIEEEFTYIERRYSPPHS